MQVAQIKDSQDRLVINPESGRPYRIAATEFQNKEQAENFLRGIETKTGQAGLSFCCGHSNCKATVHFREESKMVAGTSARARSQTWVSNNVKAHKIGCPGPHERDEAHLPHNNLKLADAIAKPGEEIVLHLNMNLGVTVPKKEFAKAANGQSNDVRWRKLNADRHSYYAATDLSNVSDYLSEIFGTGGKEALLRTRVVHEGEIPRLQDFIVRNNAADRMAILKELKAKADLRARHNIRNEEDGVFVFGKPRLLMFEAAQTPDLSCHPEKKQNARGWRYDTGNDWQNPVFDQLHLGRTALEATDISHTGALVIARPFIHPAQKDEYPMVHWSVQSEDCIDLNPPKEMRDLLCWNGQHIPEWDPPRPPRQLLMDLRP